MLVSVFMIIAGLNLTVAATSFATFPLVPAAVLKSSFLIGSIATLVAPQSMLVPLSQPIPVHPLFMIGLAGLIMSAVNMLPIGRLDGGMYLLGRKILSLKRVLSTTVKQVELQ
jgi:membrane-associated protease RseP (regulator of RpoE activity)